MAMSTLKFGTRHHRCLFLSDLHLGAIGCRGDLILEFLLRNCSDVYYLVGDIFDVCQRPRFNWSAGHQAVVDLLCSRQAAGARIIYLRGNHDPVPFSVSEQARLPVHPENQVVHQAADGRRYLVLHGDGQDTAFFQSFAMKRFGADLEYLVRYVDRLLASFRTPGATNRSSLFLWLLGRANHLLYPGKPFEKRLVELARALDLDGVIAGHFHMADLHTRHGLVYANCGDWVGSFTALAEDDLGQLHLLKDGRALVTNRIPLSRRLVTA
jgi:UDP-2,3-diacylglucosamine pyrophosphatase LpxH